MEKYWKGTEVIWELRQMAKVNYFQMLIGTKNLHQKFQPPILVSSIREIDLSQKRGVAVLGSTSYLSFCS